jgi:type I restriction enzyme M protein
MAHDGFSLDDKRNKVAENDIPDILACWRQRRDPAFAAERAARLARLKAEIEPLQAARLRLAKEINRLTFESVITPVRSNHFSDNEAPVRSNHFSGKEVAEAATTNAEAVRSNHFSGDEAAEAATTNVEAQLAAAKAEMEALQTQLAPLKAQIDQLGRQFWVTKKQVRVNKYDLSAGRYREMEHEPTFYEEPKLTMARLRTLEGVMEQVVNELEGLLN